MDAQKKKGAQILKKLIELYPQKRKEDLVEVIKKQDFDLDKSLNFLLENPTYTCYVPIETAEKSEAQKRVEESKYHKASKRVCIDSVRHVLSVLGAGCCAGLRVGGYHRTAGDVQGR